MNHLSRGIPLGFCLCLTFTGGVAALATAACTPSPATVTAVGALGACILARSAGDADVKPPMSTPAIVEDVAAYCATDVLTVVTTLEAVKAEAVRQGVGSGK